MLDFHKCQIISMLDTLALNSHLSSQILSFSFNNVRETRFCAQTYAHEHNISKANHQTSMFSDVGMKFWNIGCVCMSHGQFPQLQPIPIQSISNPIGIDPKFVTPCDEETLESMCLCGHLFSRLIGTLRTARTWVYSDVLISLRNAWLILDTWYLLQ